MLQIYQCVFTHSYGEHWGINNFYRQIYCCSHASSWSFSTIPSKLLKLFYSPLHLIAFLRSGYCEFYSPKIHGNVGIIMKISKIHDVEEMERTLRQGGRDWERERERKNSLSNSLSLSISHSPTVNASHKCKRGD